MYIDDFVWFSSISDKLIAKHNITEEEVEEIFFNHPRFRWVESGIRNGEDVYSASGQTNAGRYVVVFFIWKQNRAALICSTRAMEPDERKRFRHK